MTLVDWIVVLLLNGAVVIYGFVSARGTKTSSEWFLGARALPWWMVGISMFATNVDNADLTSMVGGAYANGLHFFTVHSVGTVLGAVLAAFWIVPAIYRSGIFTNAEYLEARFGPTTRVLSAFIQVQYRSTMLGLMTWAVYLLLTQLVGLTSFAAWSLIVIAVIFVAIYTAWGGLKSVVVTDALQGLIMIAGALVLFVVVWNVVGGWSEMVSRLEKNDLGQLSRVSGYRGENGETSPIVIACGWIIIACGYWTVNHTQTMRLMGCRSLWDMKMAALLGAALSMPMLLVCLSLGVFARVLFPNLQQGDAAFSRLVSEYLASGFRGVVVAAIVAASISTFDSMGSALSALLTRDFYARLIRRNAPDAHYVVASRYFTIGVLALGFCYIPFIAKKPTMIQALTTLIPVFVTPLLAIYVAGVFSRVHRRSGLVGLLCGGAYGVLALIDREKDLSWLQPWFTGAWVAFLWSLLFTLTPMALVTVVLGREPRQQANDVEQANDTWLERSRRELPELREHPFKSEVPRLLEPRWFALVLLAAAVYLTFYLLW